jgi:undecaprenyl-diphosphatase
MFVVQENYRVTRFILYGAMFSALVFFLLCASLSEAANPNPIDNALFLMCNEFTTAGTIKAALFISFFGTAGFFIPAYLLIVHFLIKSKQIKCATLVITIAISSLLSGWLLKSIFHKHRPPLPLVHGAGWYSFPSGHALGAFTFAGICLFLLWRTQVSLTKKWIYSGIFTAFGLAVGLSRIFLHVHYAMDVLGGLFFSIFWIISIYLIFQTVYGEALHQRMNLRHD